MKESPPDLEYAREADRWTMRFIGAQGTQEHKFTDGQTLQMTGMDGNPVKVSGNRPRSLDTGFVLDFRRNVKQLSDFK